MNDRVKETLKAALRGAARGAVLPEVMAYELAARVADRDVAFHHASQWLSLLPGFPGIYARREFYRLTLSACSHDCQLSFGTVISHPGTRIGARVYVGLHGNLGLCELGDDVLFGSDVHVLSGTRQHGMEDVDTPINQQAGTLTCVRIGGNTWIGNGARVLADVGEGSAIGAGSVVTREIPPFSVAVGNPARVVRQRK